MLDQLLGAAMEKPDMRIDALHNLAIELEHKAQYAVRRRMLGPEIEGEVAQGGSAMAASRQLQVQPLPPTPVPTSSGSNLSACATRNV